MSLAEIFVPARRPRVSPRRAPLPVSRILPDVAPGQIWLVELPSGDPAFAPALRRSLAQANVTIYDRALGAAVAAGLPPGGYAEAAAEAGDKAAGRAVRLACDGWGVLRLLRAPHSPRSRADGVRRLVEALAAARVPGGLTVRVFTATAGGFAGPEEARLDQLVRLVATYPRETSPVVVIDAARSIASRLHVVAGNGLAG